jgi:hypothetical protein
MFRFRPLDRLRPLACAVVFIALLTLPRIAGATGIAEPDGWIQEWVGLLVLEGPPASERAVHRLTPPAREILPQLETTLGARYARRFRIMLIPPGGLRDSVLARIDQTAPPWAAGYMIPSLRLGAIRIAQASRYPYGTLESVLAHEATHMLLHDAVGPRLPLWFEEGVATWQGRRWTAEDTWVYTRSLLTSDVPALANLDSSFHAPAGEADLAYAASFSFVAWNVRQHGPDLVRRILREMESRPFAAAWEAVTLEPLARAEASWRRECLIRYRWIPLLTASSTLWIGITLIGILAGIRKRARARAIRERWDAEEREAAAVDDAGNPLE